MGQVVQTNGDYTIRAIADPVSGGRIVLDTGPNIGEVRITGNLVVTGDVLNVEASQLNINDNTITVNFGETGAGVTLFYAGLEVDRGSLPNAAFVYDEINGNWLLAAGSVPGPFDFANDGTSELTPRSTSRLKLKEILTDPSTDTGDLLLIGDGNGVVKVRTDPADNGSTYQSNVVNPNDVPNKKYVDDAIQNNPTFQIISNPPVGLPLRPNSASRVIITDTDTAGSTAYFSDNTGYTTYGESAVSVLVDGTLIAQFFNNRVQIGGLEIGGGEDSFEISTKAFISNQNIFIRTQGTGRLETNYGLELHRIGVPSGYPVDATLLYSASPGSGKSGLYFYHDQGRDELISKQRALLFSMIF
jgi:hypothetical protein